MFHFLEYTKLRGCLSLLAGGFLLFPAMSFAENKSAVGVHKSGLANVQIKNDSMILLYGNSLIEQIQEEGSFESYIQAASDKKLQVRSLAYMGDEVGFRIRASKFGNHLSYLIDQWQGDRVMMAFGANESFAGESGLAKFNKKLVSYVSLIKDRHPDAKLTLISPVAAEKVSQLELQDTGKRNEDIKLYTEVIQRVAEEYEIDFIDLYVPTLALFSQTDKEYTVDGTHLSEQGSAVVGKLLAEAVIGVDKLKPIDSQSEGFAQLKKLVVKKAAEVAQAYHPSNGISYYGLRARDYEYQPEIPHYLKLANVLDRSIWEQSAELAKAIDFPELSILRAPMPSKKPNNKLGILKPSKQELKEFKLAEGFEVNCFASSEEFPELINPLQINFDAKGRLWVACFASYPHPLPGAEPEGTILIFEDTDNDGKADKRTVFASKLYLPDGFVFYKKGILASVSRKIIYLEDSDGDSVADIEEEILRGLDNSDTHHSGYLSRNPQGDIMISEALFHRGQFETPYGVVRTKDTSILSFNMDTRKLTVERQTEAPNPWKITYNKFGEAIQFYGGGQIIDTGIHDIWTPMGSSALTDLGMPFRYDKGCSAQFVESPHFPEDWQGGLLTAHLLRTNEVNYTPLKIEDGAYKAAGKKITLISSDNKIFRPTDLAFALDGSLYISDFNYPIIGHAQHSIRDENRDYSNGRIWRVTRKNTALVEKINFNGAEVLELINQLKHPLLKVRQTARVELENKDKQLIIKELKNIKAQELEDELFALEILWLKERLKSFEDKKLIKQLLASSNIDIQRAAVTSLRWWADSLEEEGLIIAKSLANSSDERVKIKLVGVISHLQKQEARWSYILDIIKAKKGTNLELVKTMEAWKSRASIASEHPLLRINKLAYLNKSLWIGDQLPTSGMIYIKVEEAMEFLLGHENNPFLNITVNDTPILIASGNPHSKESQNNINMKKGINKIEYSIYQSENYKKLVRNTVKMYITDKKGDVSKQIKYPQSKVEHDSWKSEYEAAQKANWKDYALATFKQNCANCHAIETAAVGPAIKGLFGKKQWVHYADGSKKEITIDSKYIKQSIVNPAAFYPEGQQPIMPKMLLSDKEVDALVKWIETL